MYPIHSIGDETYYQSRYFFLSGMNVFPIHIQAIDRYCRHIEQLLGLRENLLLFFSQFSSQCKG